MAQIKIFAMRDCIEQHRAALSGAIHQALVDAFAVPPDKKFQRFLALDPDDFIFPADRSPLYTIIEISIFEGRSLEARKALIRGLFQRINEACGITPQDIEITIHETPRHNWGIRGQCGDELQLSYKVNV